MSSNVRQLTGLRSCRICVLHWWWIRLVMVVHLVGCKGFLSVGIQDYYSGIDMFVYYEKM